MTNRDVYEMINETAPFESCEAWDNSGLLAGCMEGEVKGILCALDISERVVLEAKRLGANLIVSHHPILFGGRKNLREDDPEGRMLAELIRSRISVISAHTNLDKSDAGVNKALADRLEIENIHPIDEQCYVRMGEIREMTLKEFAEKAERRLGSCVRVYGQADKRIRQVCVCGGAGGEFAKACFGAGADAYVTGEMRYHDCLDLAQAGFATLQAGHDATERFAVDALHAYLSKKINAEGSVSVTRSVNDSFSIQTV